MGGISRTKGQAGPTRKGWARKGTDTFPANLVPVPDSSAPGIDRIQPHESSTYEYFGGDASDGLCYF